MCHYMYAVFPHCLPQIAFAMWFKFFLGLKFFKPV